MTPLFSTLTLKLLVFLLIDAPLISFSYSALVSHTFVFVYMREFGYETTKDN